MGMSFSVGNIAQTCRLFCFESFSYGEFVVVLTRFVSIPPFFFACVVETDWLGNSPRNHAGERLGAFFSEKKTCQNRGKRPLRTETRHEK